jgi:hypothetical protein
MNYDVACNEQGCEGTFIIADGGSDTPPKKCVYCGGENITVIPYEPERANLYDGYVYSIEQYIENNLNEGDADEISEDDIDTIADDMCSDDQLSNYIQEEISSRIHDLLENR